MADVPARRPAHPRRPPAHKSVSLRHSATPGPQVAPFRSVAQHHSKVPSSNKANPPSSTDSNNLSSSSDSKPAHTKESSGESSNADKWFERSNNQVKANAGNFPDNDPPFFLQNSSSSETPPDVADARRAQFNAQSSMLPYRPDLVQLETQGSSSEDFRSVIDDLTVENKKLKRKLRKYEKLYDAHLQQEKLFEIKVHGLPGAKKKELEETLRKFAMSLDESPKQSIPTESMTSGYENSTPALEPNITSSSHASTKFADSAYVSNSASGQNSLVPSVRDRTNRKHGRTALSRQQDIQSYLHDIPATLLPRQPVAMTEKAKRKLVVRRLEQIFAGKGAAVGGHQQPIQQQEVSQSAAHADRMAIEASGQQAKAEGVREARIMSKGEPTAIVERTVSVHDPNITKIGEIRDTSGKDSPDQRPTRPLDLDLHRAQVPKDNISYIRHLGFSPADPDTPAEESEGHGWIYLNVLANMAQLHTLNVTTDFVKKSINDYSKKFQISRDGRKVRWRGGHDVTHTSSDGSPGEGTPNSKGDGMGLARSKPSLGHASSRGSSGSPAKGSRNGSSRDKLAYVPLFFHKQESEGSEETSEEHITSWSSPQQEQVGGNSSGFTSSGMRTNSSKRKRGEDGPIIFYNKAKFCTDLSGDLSENHAPQQSNVKYNPVVTNPVGAGHAKNINDFDAEESFTRPLTMTMPPEDAMDVDDIEESGSEIEEELKFSPKAASVTYATSSAPNIHFEVSGLGGVQPTDNFKIEVQSKRTSMPSNAAANATHSARHKTYPPKIMEILRGGRAEALSLRSLTIEEEVVSTRQETLPASALPPPASLFAFDSVESDDLDDDAMSDSGAESDVSSLDNEDEHVPSTVPQMMHISSSSTDDESSESDEDEDGSLDFLAHARQLDPVTVHEQEREYNANMAEKLAEDIPAGSSAATAGGGSGFNSPASLDPRASSERRRSGSGVVPTLKRARTSENTIHSGGGKQPKLE